MKTECISAPLVFHPLNRRSVRGDFNGGAISSDGGSLLLREVERASGILSRLSQCFTDYRDSDLIEHSVASLVKQRVYGLALGYEDLNDHDILRHDPLLAVLCDRADPTGQSRQRLQDKGKALAGKSTLNRLELGGRANEYQPHRYKKIVADTTQMDRLLVELLLESHRCPPKQIILDVDATDDPLHGEQEGRFFHGYYGHYCYLPLYIFSGEHLLCARLREAGQDGAAGTLDEVKRIITQLRHYWPKTCFLLRGDSGFCREELMAWCEQQYRVDYLFGLPKNQRLEKLLRPAMAMANELYRIRGKASRVFSEFHYRTLTTWSRHRRVIGKAEQLAKGSNPRFVVTSLKATDYPADFLYEQVYCQRGNMENRIKEQQLDLFADRTSTHHLHANQLRLYFASFAYVLIQTLRRLGLAGTSMMKAQAGTIRLRLLKIGTHIRITVRNVWLAFSQSYPLQALFCKVFQQLRQLPARE